MKDKINIFKIFFKNLTVKTPLSINSVSYELISIYN